MIKIHLSKNQEQFWILHKLQKDNPAYNLPSIFRIKGHLNIEALRLSVSEIIKHHEVLRTSFIEEDGHPYQLIDPPDDSLLIKIPVIDINEQPVDFELPEAVRQEVHHSFDLNKDTLFRVKLFRLGHDDFILTIVFHHIIADLYSKEIFSNELSVLYNSFVTGSLPLIEKPSGQYSDFCTWQKDWLKNEDAKNMLAGWGNDIVKPEEVLKLPFDFLPVEKINTEGKRKHFILDIKISKMIREFSKKHLINSFTLLLTLYSVFLNKLSGQSQIIIGVPFTNRRREESKSTFGCFTNILPIQVIFNDNSTLISLIRQIREGMLKAHRKQEMPFLLLNSALGQINGKPIFQAGFTFEPPMELLLSKVDVSPVIIERNGLQLDIFLVLWENGGFFNAFLEYPGNQFKDDTITHFWEIFNTIIKSALKEPDTCIANLNITPLQDIKYINSWNNTETPFEDDLCIHQKFERQVEINPEANALLTDNQILTYKELNEQANRIAHFLINEGVKNEDKIGICLERSVEMIICILGILKAGAAYLPLSRDDPPERLQVIIRDAKPKIIMNKGNSSINNVVGCSQFNIDNVLKNSLLLNTSNPEIKVKSKSLAYLIYTSGSTGTPKGVLIEHRSVLNRLGWMQKTYPINESDTLLQKTPITFDVSVWELFWWFFNGSRLVLLPRGGEKDPETLIHYISNYKITTIHFVPSMFASFLETLTLRKLYDKLESLKLLFLSGEALPLKLVKEFNKNRESYSHPEMINLYGPTEATVDVSYFNCPETDTDNVFIGRPIDNTKLFVVNDKEKIQPIGLPGELIITGVNLARGYLNDKNLTSRKFFAFKTPDNKKVKAYRSGDLVKLTSGGELEFIGRMDNQVKIRGFRIELGEIESKIMEHPSVSSCAVIVSQNEEYKKITAYVSYKHGVGISSDELKTYLSNKLPAYMIPTHFIFLDKLPLTISGKLDRKKLPLYETSVAKNCQIPPSSQFEKKLHKLWKELLKVEKISIYDNFFDIGGNSLLAIKLTNLIAKEFNIEVNPVKLLEYPNIKEQSDLLANNKEHGYSLIKTEIDEKMQRKKNIHFKKKDKKS